MWWWRITSYCSATVTHGHISVPGRIIRRTIMRRFSLMLVLLLPCAGQVLQPQPISASVGGTISGTLTGDDGTLISGTVVGLTVVPPYPPGRLRQTEWTTVSGDDGSFEF